MSICQYVISGPTEMHFVPQYDSYLRHMYRNRQLVLLQGHVAPKAGDAVCRVNVRLVPHIGACRRGFLCGRVAGEVNGRRGFLCGRVAGELNEGSYCTNGICRVNVRVTPGGG
jgi:hypothetical protein